MAIGSIVVTWALVGVLVLIGTNRRALLALWREPVLKVPVLIVESDDWGAGPLEQAERLEQIAEVLGVYTDRDGRRPVMTLGLVLGVADGARVAADAFRHHYRKSLADSELTPVLAAIRHGTERGVFALQLHGGEHYWPSALLAAARDDSRVAGWLNNAGILKTEELPSALQSRWVDASELPSKPLASLKIKAAALTEVAEFRKVCGQGPAVSVPPTFVWNDYVEAAWAEAGVQFVVTPGRRYETRAANGMPGAASAEILNGESGAARIRYLVRDDYFEPARGHKAERALEALAAKTRLGRPTLLETHRANFLCDAATARAAVGELHRLLGLALRNFPDLAFLSTEELASRMCRNDPWLVEVGFWARLHIWLRRLWQVDRLRKLAWVTGAIAPAWVLYMMTRAAAPRPSDV